MKIFKIFAGLRFVNVKVIYIYDSKQRVFEFCIVAQKKPFEETLGSMKTVISISYPVL